MKVRLKTGKKLPNRTTYYPGVYNVPDDTGRAWVAAGDAVMIGSPPPKVAEPPDITLQSTPDSEPEPEPPEADDYTPQED